MNSAGNSLPKFLSGGAVGCSPGNGVSGPIFGGDNEARRSCQPGILDSSLVA